MGTLAHVVLIKARAKAADYGAVHTEVERLLADGCDPILLASLAEELQSLGPKLHAASVRTT
jgi:hypothetical protein